MNQTSMLQLIWYTLFNYVFHLIDDGNKTGTFFHPISERAVDDQKKQFSRRFASESLCRDEASYGSNEEFHSYRFGFQLNVTNLDLDQFQERR